MCIRDRDKEVFNVGDNKNRIDNVSKIVSGSNKKTLDRLYLLYKSVLSSKIYNFTFEGQWELAATPSIILIIFSSVAVLLLYKEMNKNE